MDQNSPCSALDLVFKRRSCRVFTDTPITPEELDSILRAGCCAPTSKALYPCHFLVVDSRGEMQKICEYHNMSKALVTAPLCVITCADTARSWASWRDDAAAATMNRGAGTELLLARRLSQNRAGQPHEGAVLPSRFDHSLFNPCAWARGLSEAASGTL